LHFESVIYSLQGVVKALQSEADKFSLTLSLGSITVRGSVSPSQNGLFFGSFLATISGVYTVNVKYASIHLFGSPFNVQVFAAASDAGQSRVMLPGGVMIGTAGTEFDVFVQPADAYANLLRPADVSQADNFIGTLAMQSGLVEFPQKKTWRNSSQGLPITFFATFAGRFSAAILLNGKNISNSPFNVVVIAAPASALFSSLIISDDKKTVVAGLPLVFRVAAYDMVRSPAPHENVFLESKLTLCFFSTIMQEQLGGIFLLSDPPVQF
jgi:hypothetical protein